MSRPTPREAIGSPRECCSSAGTVPSFPLSNRFCRSGRLPNLSSLLGSGACVELVAPRPALPPAAWTSLATGKRPHEHGILHANCPSSDGSNLRPITRSSRQSVAIWNVLNRAGLRTHIVGWPVTHPAEAVVWRLCLRSVRGAFCAAPLKRGGGPAVSPPAVEPILRAPTGRTRANRGNDRGSIAAAAGRQFA